MKNTKIPDNYRSALNLHDTQVGIKTVKDSGGTPLRSLQEIHASIG